MSNPAMQSWVPVPEGSDFPIQNLPYGVFVRGDAVPRIGVAIGEHIVDMFETATAGMLPRTVGEAFTAPALNEFIALGADAWSEARERIAGLLSTDGRQDLPLVPMSECRMVMPVEIGDYVDFYSSLHHAMNLGRMFRPDAEPLLPNWRHLPVGYHGRSATVVVDGTPVVRPSGQHVPPNEPVPVFGPSKRLDFELEIGFLTGPANRLGHPIPIERAADHIFGLVLVNDWSARDIQAWEYQPLGPFLGKSFATTISPWVMPLEATIPYRVPAPAQDPQPLEHLRASNDFGLDLNLEVSLLPPGGEASVITRTNARELYWTMAQQLAHATSNGAVARPGDLFASGTISGPEPGSCGSMIEAAWNGSRPIVLTSGETRAFLEDGDTVRMRGWFGGDGRPRIGFGPCGGTIQPARA